MFGEDHRSMMPNPPKIIVAHPGQQHSYHLAGALSKAGYLQAYITTVYDSKCSIWMKLTKFFINKKNRFRADQRSSSLIPEDKVIQFCELRGLITLAIIRLDKSRILYNWFSHWVAKSFGRKVANYAIAQEADAVICYDAAAYDCFNILKNRAPQIIRIIDNAAMNRYGLYQLYQEMHQRWGILKNPSGFKEYLLNEKKARFYKDEALLADYHIVASSFSLQTITRLGIPKENVFVIPYGVAVEKISKKEEYAQSGRLKVLYVGEVSPQKGIYNLLEVCKALSGAIEMHVVGGGYESLCQEIREQIKELTVYHGYLLQKELFKLYAECDVFLFPSLGDGFGFVVIEAMAAGLPVICSSNSVGADAIADFENGFTYPAGDTHTLKDKIQYFITHRDEVKRMGENARKKAMQYTWQEYNAKISKMAECALTTEFK